MGRGAADTSHPLQQPHVTLARQVPSRRQLRWREGCHELGQLQRRSCDAAACPAPLARACAPTPCTLLACQCRRPAHSAGCLWGLDFQSWVTHCCAVDHTASGGLDVPTVAQRTLLALLACMPRVLCCGVAGLGRSALPILLYHQPHVQLSCRMSGGHPGAAHGAPGGGEAGRHAQSRSIVAPGTRGMVQPWAGDAGGTPPIHAPCLHQCTLLPPL